MVEVLRIGNNSEDGPEQFGRLASIAVDRADRIWVLDEQAQELRVFSDQGEHVRTIGRKGSGPGEFAQAIRVDVAPDGNMWVMDRGNARISVFDTAGRYVESKRVATGFLIRFGGFDSLGRYYEPLVRMENTVRFAMLRHSVAFDAADTIELPTDPVKRQGFELIEGSSRLTAGIPFQGRMRWRLASSGSIWTLVTDQYRLSELSPSGDTLRSVTREFQPIAVTDADRTKAREELAWFTEQGGRVDWSRVPKTKPLATNFLLDDSGAIWVALAEVNGELRDSAFDIFDEIGRYLGRIVLPFTVDWSFDPIFREGTLYAATRDDSEIPYLVAAKIGRH